MIYLIGGPSRSGKTKLAAAILQKTGALLLPLDYIEAAITEWYPHSSIKDLRPFSGMRDSTDRDNEQLVEQYSAQQIAEAYITQGKSTWNSIEAMLNYALVSGDSIIIEGYQITPTFVCHILNKYDPSLIKAVFLLKEDEELIIDGWKTGKPEHDWLLDNSTERTIKKYAQITSLLGKMTKVDAEKCKCNYVNTERDFASQIEKALLLLDKP